MRPKQTKSLSQIFKNHDRETWISIQKEKTRGQYEKFDGKKQSNVVMHLNEVTIHKQKHQVMSHFILYPTLGPG